MSVTLRTRVFETSVDSKSGERKLTRIASKYQKYKTGAKKGQYKLDAKGRKIKMRVSNPTYEYYLDIYQKGLKRQAVFIGIFIYPEDDRASKMDKEQSAKLIINQYSNDLITGRFGVENLDKANTYFITYANRYMEQYSSKDIRKVQGTVRHFCVFFQTRNKSKDVKQDEINKLLSKGNNNLIQDPTLTLSQFTKKIAADFIDYIKQFSNLKGETPLAYVKKLKAILKDAENDEYIRKSPFEGISTKKITEKVSMIKKEMLTAEEIQQLATTKCSNEFIKRAFLFACFTGLGMAEIKQLKWQDIDLNKKMLTYGRSKTKVGTEVNLAQNAIAVLYGIDQTTSKVFESFRIPSNEGINKVIKTWVKSASIDKHITFYCARHSFGSLILRGSKNLKLTADLMGHTSTRYTTLYTTVLKDEKEDTINVIDQKSIGAVDFGT